MKARGKTGVIFALLTCVIAAAGFLMPEAAVRVADHYREKETESFETGTLSSLRLTDRLRLAASYDQEISVESGAVRGESEIRKVGEEITRMLMEAGVIEEAEFTADMEFPFLAVSSERTDLALLWMCSRVNQQGERLEYIIDDESGKMLRFSYTYGGDFKTAVASDSWEKYGKTGDLALWDESGQENGASLQDGSGKTDDEALQDESGGADAAEGAQTAVSENGAQRQFCEKTERLRQFCEDYYDLQAGETKYDMSGAEQLGMENELFVARIPFTEEEGQKITFTFQEDLWGFWLVWN